MSTASPMVAPDGDVYLGVFGNPNNGSRGFLLRFSPDLSVTKTPGGFGWDYTPALVPASMVPSYTGGSSYLLFAKYNSYAIQDGIGLNRIAILDPNATQIDPHTSAPGLVEMREVLTAIGPVRDHERPSFPLAVREWCINAPAVDLANQSVLVPCEDGYVYRWNLALNSLSEALSISPGVGQPYVPTVIGPDGTVFTLNGGTLFALGAHDGVNISLASSAPDLRNSVVGEAITFTTTVSASGVSPHVPTGTVTFTDLTYNSFTPVTTVLAANVPLDANGIAAVTTASLTAGGNFLGNHHITATYSGDGNFAGGSVLRVQKVHAYATTTSLTCSSPAVFGQSVVFTATVSAAAGVPTGMVTFSEGTSILGQRPLNASGVCTLAITGFPVSSHTLRATYAADTHYAASTGNVALVVEEGTSTTLTSAPNPSAFGQAVALTATVTAAHPSAGIPVGIVTFREGGTTLGSIPVNAGGEAVLSVSTLTSGLHLIVADFAGSSGWVNSSSGATEHTVNPDSTPPSIPTGVAATPGPGRRKIVVSWNPSTDASGIARYDVYRSPTRTGLYSVAGSVSAPTTTYVDSQSLSQLVRWYYVVAVDNAGNSSADSAIVKGFSN